MLGENGLIFALDPKLEMDTETLVLQSGQKFMCFEVHFCEKFWFWHQTGIVCEKVYAVVWPLLEISSLNLYWKLKNNKHLEKIIYNQVFVVVPSFVYVRHDLD